MTRFRRITRFAMAAAWLLAWAAAPGQAADGASPDKAAPAADLAADADNPLVGGQDPFVGTFVADKITLRLQMAGDDRLEGTLEQNGRTFPVAAARVPGKFKGTFTSGGKQFPLSLTLEEDTLHLFSGNRLFVLQRVRQPAAGAAVAGLPGVPAAPGAPVNPQLQPLPALPVDPPPTPSTPGKPPTPPTTPAPPAPPALPAVAPPAQPQPVTPAAALPPLPRAEKGRAWAGFPKGTYALFETTTKQGDILPHTARTILQFVSADQGGKEMLRRHLSENSRWQAGEVTPCWLDGARTLEQMGFTAGQPRQENLTVDGAPLACQVIDYERVAEGNVDNGRTRVQLWRASVDTPPQAIAWGEDGFLLLETGVVRFVTIDEGRSPKVDLKLTSLKETYTVGRRRIEVATFKGEEMQAAPDGKFITIHERLVSPFVPGGVAKLTVDKRRGQTPLASLTEVVVEFGPSMEEAKPRP